MRFQENCLCIGINKRFAEKRMINGDLIIIVLFIINMNKNVRAELERVERAMQIVRTSRIFCAAVDPVMNHVTNVCATLISSLPLEYSVIEQQNLESCDN